ncbi:Crp/Fnr family transcriptional regulator [Leptospira sp. GIMC2001]|uniref:Crp/Fnr family transcriptional regulator n=1 Tax=Leptospira sp. GIMC2001 TaxID=1513297 RepID=UPI002349392F|nr:cyclic nucleotide-binding domain-containing protein [Leptospira sp. GIMC2001]WCL50328.1 cyclic nucleotide-binding domain-containing protein [Leptospira sp. GIMC2001]
MESNEQILKKIYLFSHFDEAEIAKISEISTQISIPHNDTVFQEGNDASSFYVVKYGTLKITANTQGGDDINITTISVGDHFGELPFFDHEKRAATVESLEKSDLIEIKYKDLEKVLETSPSMQVKFYRSIAFNLIKRVRMLTQDLTYAREIKKRFT